MAIHTCSAWLLPLRATGWQASKAKTLSVAACVAVADGHGHRWRRRLQTRRHVNGVSGEEALAAGWVDVEAHEHLAAVDPDADLDGSPADAGQCVDLVDQAQAGAHGALGVVLVEGGDAEDGDHGVADELLDGAAVGLDDAARDRVVAAQHGVDDLGVVALRERREAHEVAEEGRDDSALSGSPSRGQWPPQFGQMAVSSGASWPHPGQAINSAAYWLAHGPLAPHPIDPSALLSRYYPASRGESPNVRKGAIRARASHATHAGPPIYRGSDRRRRTLAEPVSRATDRPVPSSPRPPQQGASKRTDLGCR